LPANGNGAVRTILEEKTMKTITCALIVLSVLAGIVAPASALDAKNFYEQQERQSGGTAN
jgi:hypothetical protein